MIRFYDVHKAQWLVVSDVLLTDHFSTSIEIGKVAKAVQITETRPPFTPFQNYLAGQIIFQNEQADNRLFVVADGSVAIYYKQKLVEIIRAGHFFSDPLLSQSEKFRVTAVASTDCRIIALTPDEFDLLKQYDSPLLKLTLKTMANCLGA